MNPTVEAVLHKKIVTENDKGFAITYVPESDTGPHMAKAGEDRYYKRSGDSFYRMEHFDIEDMFGRRKKPKLALCTEVKGGGGSGSGPYRQIDCHLFVGLENTGRGLAKHVAVEINLNAPYRLDEIRRHIGENYGFWILRRIGSNARLISLGSDVAIHPKSSLRIALIPFKVMESGLPPQDVIIDATIMAEDMHIIENKIIIKGSDIREMIMPRKD